MSLPDDVLKKYLEVLNVTEDEFSEYQYYMTRLQVLTKDQKDRLVILKQRLFGQG